MKKVIEVKNLTKKYHNFTAVDNINFEVRKGEIFGLLGENGAGKTTTLEMIEGLRKPTSGKIKVFELDTTKNIAKIKDRIGVQLQSSAYFEYLNLKEILELFGSFYNKSADPIELLKMVELEEKSKNFVKQLSGGQKQRFSIVASLVNDPEVVFLDEPTTGLDPVSRRRLWDIISKIKNSGKTVVLTTHYLEEAEILCDYVAIMVNGKIVAMNETHKLIEQAKHPYKLDFFSRKIDKKIIDKIKIYTKLENVGGKQNHFEARLEDAKNLFVVVDLIKSLDPETLTVGRAKLEDVFIELTGKNIEDVEEESDVD